MRILIPSFADGKCLLLTGIGISTFRRGDRHRTRIHGQRPGLYHLFLIGHGDLLGIMEVDRQRRAILGFCGAAVVVDPDDLLNAAGIVHLDRHATEIQRIAGGVDQALRGLVPLFDGHHHVLHRLDRDLLADAVRRNSEFVRAYRQAGLIQRKVGNRRLVAGGINVRHRQSIFDILLRGGIIEDHAILHANIQRGRQDDRVLAHLSVVRCIALDQLNRGKIRSTQRIGRFKEDLCKNTTLMRHFLGARPGSNTIRAAPTHNNNITFCICSRLRIRAVSGRHFCRLLEFHFSVVELQKQIVVLRTFFNRIRISTKVDPNRKPSAFFYGVTLFVFFARYLSRKIDSPSIRSLHQFRGICRKRECAHQHCQNQQQRCPSASLFSHSAYPPFLHIIKRRNLLDKVSQDQKCIFRVNRAIPVHICCQALLICRRIQFHQVPKRPQ